MRAAEVRVVVAPYSAAVPLDVDVVVLPRFPPPKTNTDCELFEGKSDNFLRVRLRKLQEQLREEILSFRSREAPPAESRLSAVASGGLWDPSRSKF